MLSNSKILAASVQLAPSPAAPHRWVRWPWNYDTVPLALWIAAMSWGSLTSSSNLPAIEVQGADKLGHLGMYAVLGGLMLRAWVRRGRVRLPAALGVVAVAAVWGVYLEYLQSLTPDRAFEGADLLANALGALVGVTGWSLAHQAGVNARRRRAARAAAHGQGVQS